MAEGQYKFSIGLDDKQLDLDIQQAKKAFDDLVKAARDAGAKIDKSFKNPFEGLTPPADLPQRTQAAAQSFNGLNMATQSLVRELPAATMGLNTFFLAVSNNLPIFADQIKAASAANKELQAQGKPTVGVFKQIIGSLFSWQTALIAGVTVLTLYGKEIGNWIKGLFKGKEALDAVAQAEKILADVRRQATLDAQEEIVQMQLAVKAMQDNNRSMAERKRAMRTLQDQYPEYFGKLREEQMLYGEVGDSVDVLIKKMVALATARKSFDKLVENEQKLTLLKDTKGYAKMMSAADTFTQMGGYRYVMTNSLGQRVKIKEQRKHYNHPETEEYQALLDAQEAFLDNLEEGGKAAEAIFEEISDKYDGNVGAYIKAIEESNKKLTEEASALITTPDLSEDKAAAEEQKRKAEAVLAEAERQAEERKRAIQRLNNDLSKEVQRTQREMDDAEIAATKDGIERKSREIQAGYERRAAEIDKYEADIKAAQGGELTPEQKGHISYLRRANTDTLMAGKVLIKAMQDEAAQEATDAMNEYLIAYGTFQEKLKATTIKYNRLIAEAETEGERMALETERDAILAEYEVQASDFAKSLVDMTTAQLNTMLEELQAQVDAKQAAFDALDSSSSDDAKKYRDEINQLKAKIKELQAQLGKAKKEASDGNWAEAAQVIQGIGNAATDAAEGMEVFDEGFATALRSVANVTSATTNLLSGIQMLVEGSTAATAAIRAMETASVILAVIAAAIQLVSALVSAFSNKEMKETIAKFKELNAEIAQMNKLAKIDNWGDTIFGKDAFGNFNNNLRVMREASEELNATKQNIQDYRYNKQKEYYEYLLQYHTHNAQEEAYIQSKLDELEQEERSLIGELGDMLVTLGKRKRSTLAEQLPDMFEDGEVTLEELEKLQQSDVWDKLSQENRDLISQMIAAWQVYEDATKAVNDYLKDVFGELGQEINDAIVDAFVNGTDAAEAFGDVAGKVMENLIKQIGYTAYIAPILSKAMADVEALNGQNLSAEDYLNALMGIVGDTMKAAEDAVDGYNEFLERSDQMADEQGINAFDSERSGAAKGIAQASQDSVDDLNGRMTAVQSHTFALVEGQKRLISDSAQILRHLAGIESNTAELRQMRVDMRAMRSDISDMATRGVIMR